jgi:hypothetical protein
MRRRRKQYGKTAEGTNEKMNPINAGQVGSLVF